MTHPKESTPAPMQGLADWLRLIAPSFGKYGETQYRWADEVEAAAHPATPRGMDAQRVRDYEAGWNNCAIWAHREDLLADTDSPAYIKERDALLAASPSEAVQMTPLEAKLKLTMRISYERAGTCFWHLNCDAQRHAPPMKVEREDKTAKRTLLRCTACNAAGWYPYGSVGEVCCEREAEAVLPGVQAVAWMTEDEERVVTAKTKAQNDIGAGATAMRSYTVPLVPAVAPSVQSLRMSAEQRESLAFLGKLATDARMYRDRLGPIYEWVNDLSIGAAPGTQGGEK